MRPSKVTDEKVFAAIAEVFRRYGYGGASVRLLAKAAGLESASLYSRFPGGKEEMALQVIARTGEWFGANVVDSLHSSGTPANKVALVASRLWDFYREGNLWCALDALTLGDSTPAVRAAIRGLYDGWFAAFLWIARSAGVPAAEARLRAQQALIEIQGSLVLARVTQDTRSFSRVIQRLPELLTKG